MKKLFAVVILWPLILSAAQVIRVDINNSGRTVIEGNTPGYTPWSTNTTWYNGENSISNTFNGVKVRLTRLAPSGSGFRTGYWKDGVLSSLPVSGGYPQTNNCKLVADGVRVSEDTAGNLGGQIEMRISGLSAGPHTLLAYHNIWDAIASNSTGDFKATNNTPCLNIFVNDIQVITNLPCTVRVTNSVHAAISYLNLNATAGQDMVVKFVANASIAAANTNVVINGFEIDTGNPQLAIVITNGPVDITNAVSDTAVMTIGVKGIPLLYYQWYFNLTTALPDQTNATLSIPNVQFTDAGLYRCVVSDGSLSVTSAVAMLTVTTPTVPVISSQPQDFTNPIGSGASFFVTANGSQPLKYQWYFNTNTLLPGCTNSSLPFIISSTNQTGFYRVIVINSFGSVTSQQARLNVRAFTSADLPAFPGADGVGRHATGGRGGSVYHVTKLNSALDDPNRAAPGTLLYGLSSGARTIVFDVAGVFHLGKMDTATWSSQGNAWDATSRQAVGANSITIAGQTAPGPVIIMGGTIKLSGQNQIWRNITVAAGYGMKGFWETGSTPPSIGTLPLSYTMDCMEIDGQNLMIDHVDTVYSSDEVISCNELANNFTVQYGICALAQNYHGHGLGHLYECANNHRLSSIYNLDAHVKGREPQIGHDGSTGPGYYDFRCNIQYNCGGGHTGGDWPTLDNFIHNFYLFGPGGDQDWNSTGSADTGIFGAAGLASSVFVTGNVLDSNHDGDANDSVSTDADIVTSNPASSAFDLEIGATMNAGQAFTNVLRYAGSRWWERDINRVIVTTNAANAMSARLAGDALNGTGRFQAWADDPYNVSGTYQLQGVNEGSEWRSLWALRMDSNGNAPFNRPANWDTDGDGMPDGWEIKRGVNPNVANNNSDFDNDGYTDLEEYLNEIAAWPAFGPILFTGDESSRFARIFNWRIYGAQMPIGNYGNVTTFSFLQPCRYDTAIISNATCVVDAMGQQVGTLRLTNNGVLNITAAGCLEASSLDIGNGSAVSIKSGGRLRLTGSGAITLAVGATFDNAGVLDLLNWNGTLPAGFVNSGTVLDRNSLVMSSVTVSGVNVLVKIQGYRGHSYMLQYRNDLTGGTWQEAASPVIGADSLITFTHLDGGAAGQSYYRILVVSQ